MIPFYPLGDFKVNAVRVRDSHLTRRRNMQTEIIIAGFGGQGVLFAGQLLVLCRHG